jgi:hypothetical protein
MLDLVVDASRAALPNADVVCVGGECQGGVSIPGGDSFLSSVKAGLGESTSERVLVVAADSPFLTSEAVRDFVDRAPESAVLAWPVVPAELCEKAFPGMKRTTLKVREGRFTGGNMAIVRREEFGRVQPQLERAYANRKHPFALARQVGIWTLVRVGIGQLIPASLPLRVLEGHVSRFLGVEARAVIVERPEVGADVDSFHQYLRAKELLEGE